MISILFIGKIHYKIIVLSGTIAFFYLSKFNSNPFKNTLKEFTYDELMWLNAYLESKSPNDREVSRLNLEKSFYHASLLKTLSEQKCNIIQFFSNASSHRDILK